MGKIQITFHEEGDSPTRIEIHEGIAEVLNQHVAWLQAEGVPVASKTHMFMLFTWQNWLKPILERHGISVRQMSGPIGQQIEQLEQQLLELKQAEEMAALQSVIRIVPDEE